MEMAIANDATSVAYCRRLVIIRSVLASLSEPCVVKRHMRSGSCRRRWRARSYRRRKNWILIQVMPSNSTTGRYLRSEVCLPRARISQVRLVLLHCRFCGEQCMSSPSDIGRGRLQGLVYRHNKAQTKREPCRLICKEVATFTCDL